MSSSTSEHGAGLFAGVYGSPAVDAATGDVAWTVAMLRFEGALALAAGRVGLVPPADAQAAATACDPSSWSADDLDRLVADLGAGAVRDATPVVTLVRHLRDRAGAGAADAVHVAATSQDVLDTAAVLVTRAALGAVRADVDAVVALLADLAREHRDTVQIGRSLLQHGAPTTFGAHCAARLVAVREAGQQLDAVRHERLAVQLGGAVGTLAPAGPRGPDLLREVARELGLAEPVTPWHTTRGRVAQVAAACGVLAGELAAVAQDVVLLSQTEIAEVAVAQPGGSSAMAHKQNPARAVLALAAAHRVPGLVATVLAGMPQELQRSAGRWQAEWGTLTELLRLLGGVAAHTRATLTGLRVDAGRMLAAAQELGGPQPGTGSAGAFVDRALAGAPAGAPAGTPAGTGTGAGPS